MTFDEAVDDAIDWIARHASPTGASGPIPRLSRPGLCDGAAGIGVAPWRLDTPRMRRDGDMTVRCAAARIAVWAWAPDARAACAVIDALFFAAMTDPDWRLSTRAAPAAFWQGAAPLSLILTRDIERAPAAPRAGRVERPLVFDIDAGAAPPAPARERT